MAYRLQLPKGFSHTSSFPNELKDKFLFCFPNQILDSRTIQLKDEPIQAFVQWNKRGPEAATLEEVSTLQDQFLEFNLEDKVVPASASNDRQGSNKRGWKAYYRKEI